jgi:hypothetical protein
MSNLIQFPGSRTEQPEAPVERDRERRGRLSRRDREAVQSDIDRHLASRQAYGQALARVTAIEDGHLPEAQMADAQLKAFEAYSEMTEAARRLLVVMPTDPKALVDLLMYLEKNFSVLPPEIATGASNGQSLAFDLLRTVRLSLRDIAKYGKRGPTS